MTQLEPGDWVELRSDWHGEHVSNVGALRKGVVKEWGTGDFDGFVSVVFVGGRLTWVPTSVVVTSTARLEAVSALLMFGAVAKRADEAVQALYVLGVSACDIAQARELVLGALREEKEGKGATAGRQG